LQTSAANTNSFFVSRILLTQAAEFLVARSYVTMLSSVLFLHHLKLTALVPFAISAMMFSLHPGSKQDSHLFWQPLRAAAV